MMTQWVEIPRLKGDVECTSLVTRIAENLGVTPIFKDKNRMHK
jgi:hypothetical protein